MKTSRSIGWPIVILALGLTTNACYGDSTTASQENPSTTTEDPVSTVFAGDVFVPYQGERSTLFDWNLLKLMGNKYQGNLLVSPISVKMALVLLYEGALDQTALELAEVMHFPAGRWATRDKFLVILKSLKPVFNEYKLDIGTRMFVDARVDTKQSYAAIVKAFYGSDVVSTDFTNTHEAAETINNWVSNVTHGNIDKIVEDEDSIRDSVMLVINALYFKGSWHKNRFSLNETRSGKFFQRPGHSIDVPFMNTIGNFYYTESLELDAKILRIPYVGHKFAMYFVLPRTVGGIEKLQMNVTPYQLTRQVSLMQDLPIEVKIPKFKFDFTSHLETVLRELGIRDIFDNTATLTGIARAKRTSQRLVVSDIVQKAGIEVTEEGTTAFATTEVVIGNKMAEQEFIADHPFLFYIEDEITGTILFMGRVSNPLEEVGSTDTGMTPSFPTRLSEEDKVQPTGENADEAGSIVDNRLPRKRDLFELRVDKN